MRIVFMGTPDFAKKSLEAVYNANHNIIAVVTNADKPKGRGMKMIYTPVKEFAIEKNLPIYQPLKIRNNTEFIDEIRALNPDVLCVVAYGKILPKEILDIPKYGAINVHGSLLPKYRGAAPIQWAVINGEKETGITTMFMDEGMDTGDMILKEKVSIRENETTGELWDELSNIGAKLLVETLNKIEEIREEISIEEKNRNNDEIKEKVKKLIGATKQGEDFTLAPMLNKDIALIDWNKTAIELHNLIRGLDPIMGAYTFYNDKKLKIWKVKVLNEEEFRNMLNNAQANCLNIFDKDEEDLSNNIEKSQNGQIIFCNKKQGLFVKTGDGILSLLEVQSENAKRMDIKSFLNGNEIETGIVLK